MKTLILTVALFLSACSASLASDDGKITTDNYNKIKLGTSLQTVYSILGQETVSDSETMQSKTLIWRTGTNFTDKKITIIFNKDKVYAKYQNGL